MAKYIDLAQGLPTLWAKVKAYVKGSNVSITDAGNYFTSTHAEGALQEVGETLSTQGETLSTVSTAVDGKEDAAEEVTITSAMLNSGTFTPADNKVYTLDFTSIGRNNITFDVHEDFKCLFFVKTGSSAASISIAVNANGYVPHWLSTSDSELDASSYYEVSIYNGFIIIAKFV